MNPSRPFILRPVATALLMAAIVLGGLVGFRLLPLSALPEVDYPTIQVQTVYPGASPEVMAQTVTAPLERQFGQMSGLDRMSSVSSAGASVVTLQFNLGESLDVAEQEVQAAINAGGNLLPADLPAPPVPGLSPGSWTRAPSVRRSPPSVITFSPACRPWTRLTVVAVPGPRTTLRRVTVLSGCSFQTKSPWGPVRTAVTGTTTAPFRAVSYTHLTLPTIYSV